jgi:hypothetical protein
MMQDQSSETIARAIWEGNTIMGTDGSIVDPAATYSFKISHRWMSSQMEKAAGFLFLKLISN